MSKFFSVLNNSGVIEIDDENVSTETTFSSFQINKLLSELQGNLKKLEDLIISSNFIVHIDKDFSNDNGFTTIINLNTLIDVKANVLNNATIDVTNLSISDMNYKIFSGNNLLQQGVIRPGRILSFETQRNDLFIQADGNGNVKGKAYCSRIAN